MLVEKIYYGSRNFVILPGINIIQESNSFLIKESDLGIEIQSDEEDVILEVLSEKITAIWDSLENLSDEELKNRFQSRVLEVFICPVCHRQVRPKNIHFALRDVMGNWYHLDCLQKILPQLLAEHIEKNVRELNKLDKLKSGEEIV